MGSVRKLLGLIIVLTLVTAAIDLGGATYWGKLFEFHKLSGKSHFLPNESLDHLFLYFRFDSS